MSVPEKNTILLQKTEVLKNLKRCLLKSCYIPLVDTIINVK